MKVCTDACLFGAWIAHAIGQDDSIRNILDIGTGTGLLSLLLAQKTKAVLDAVELDEFAAGQAEENFSSSPWKPRLSIFNAGIAEFYPDKQYDLIISNPPFFENDLKSGNNAKNAAKHDSTLTLEALMLQIRRLLKKDGKACILIPFHRTTYMEDLIQGNGYFTNHKMLVKQSNRHDFFRTMLIFSGENSALSNSTLSIKENDNTYSMAFTGLLKDYYLKL